MSKIRTSVVNMVFGGAGYVVPMFLNLVFTPVIVSNLGSEAYGLQSIVNVLIGFLMVADLGLDIPVTKFVSEYQAKGEKSTVNRILNSTLQIYLLIGIAGMLITAGLSQWLVTDIFEIPPHLHSEGLSVFVLSGVGFLGGILAMWGKSVFNGLQRYDVGNGISIVSNLLSTMIGIGLVIGGYGVVPFVFVKVVFSILSGIVFLYYGRKLLPAFKFQFGIDAAVWLMLKAQIGYGFILRISGVLFSRMDQTLIGAWIGISAVGVYAIPFVITSSLLSLIASVSHFVFPMTSELHSTQQFDALNSVFLKMSRFIAMMSCLLFVPLLIFGDKFLVLWIGGEVGTQGGTTLMLLGVATLSSCLSNIVINSYVLGIGQIRIYAIWAIARGLLMTVGCFFLIRPMGIEGAAFALISTCLIDYVYFVFVVTRLAKMNVGLVLRNAYAKPVLLALVLGVALYFLRPFAGSWTGLILSCALFGLAYVGLGVAISMFGETEKKAISALWNIVVFK